MRKVTVFTFIVIISINAISCKSKDTLDFCKMYNSDQSFLYSKDKTEEENTYNLKKRKSIFLENYYKLKSVQNISEFGFVSEKMKNTSDSCIYLAFFSTYIHISQTQPEIFYSQDNIADLEHKIKNRFMDKNLAYTAVKIGSFSPVCATLKNNIYQAIQKWQLDTVLLKEFTYKSCH